MLFDFILPDIGEGVHEATILEWKCTVGDAVREGDVLAVVETDKVVAEIPSPRPGVVRRLGPEAGQTIQVGEILARIEIASEEEGGIPKESASVVGTIEASGSMLLEASLEGIASAPPIPQREDSLREAENRREPNRKVRATPVARRLAALEGIDLSSLHGSGPSGRILKEDILGELESRGNGHGAAAPSNTQPAAAVAVSAVQRSDQSAPSPERLSTLRRTMARNLEASWRIPAALIHDFAMVDDLVDARRSLNKDAQASGYPKLSYLPFFIKAAAVSLKQFPLLNAWYDEQNQIVNAQDAANIGFALDSQEGLIVPVIEGADRLTLSQIQEQINLRRSEAANRELRIEHLRGGTFTVSNYGTIGGTYGRPMILPPQVAVLGLGRIHQAPVAIEGELAVATILPLSLVFDHRVCDGAYAVRLLNSFIELVSKPIRILR
ncbi:MAG: 2-oxo acid dehydrogenase subunit E2 [Spirochaetaceae bacterium]|nr:MAG: 2-oxo acid dehydrogenase subunit E2 [Spirochaetaceae bacterium]